MKHSAASDLIVSWAPPEWFCNSFPLEAPDQRIMTMERLVFLLQTLLDATSEENYTPLQKVLHVAHILVTMQGNDGLWPSEFDLVTAAPLSPKRSDAPLPLFQRLNAMLASSEFEHSLRYAQEKSRDRAKRK
ncbi:hypothetical protein [Chthonomonas calidirosea]|uniref:hypothetical protein n=1 Tax=Chthonomonas calidirosea TaxID=454171 RepID=UPI0006EC7761|nr:hypothetical protein [Chthonomonas calidirosea]CEK13121.1 hypothetical protein CP488_00371 [Chthonomonas calidirosea]